VLVREVVEHLATRFNISEREIETATENMLFKLPRELAA
jgi:4-hydroxy-3-methylbut-2-enyl diphosphate reductase